MIRVKYQLRKQTRFYVNVPKLCYPNLIRDTNTGQIRTINLKVFAEQAANLSHSFKQTKN